MEVGSRNAEVGKDRRWELLEVGSWNAEVGKMKVGRWEGEKVGKTGKAQRAWRIGERTEGGEKAEVGPVAVR